MFPQPSERTAIAAPGLTLSYRQLVSQIAHLTKSLPALAGERVILIGENTPQWVVSFYAIWQAKGVVVPLDPGLPPEELAQILGDAQPALVFADPGLFEGLSQALRILGSRVELKPLTPLDPGLEQEPVLALPAPEDLKALAVMPYTSGTTGQAKGVMLSYENLLANADAVRANGYFKPEDNVIGLLPFYHILPLQGSIVIPFLAGCKLAFVANLQSQEIARALREEEVSLVVGVPRLYDLFHAAIGERVRAGLVGRILFALSRGIGSRKFGRLIFGKVHRNFGPSVKHWISGGAKADPIMLREMWALGFKMIEGYGLTETAPIVSFNPQEAPRLGTAGKPLPGTEVRIENDEIVVRGKNLMLGYYNNPEATQSAIRDGWFYTGDLGFFDKKGYLVVNGRKDEMLVLPNGKNISPEEIEKNLIETSAAFQEVGVLQHQGLLVAVIRPVGEDLEASREEIDELIAAYNRGAPSHRRLSKIALTAQALPRTRLGKLRRFALKDLFVSAQTEKGEGPAPEIGDASLKKICEFLSRRKKVPVYPESRFDLDLGFDSLDRLELASFFSAELGLSLGFNQLSEAQTPNEALTLAVTASEDESSRYAGVFEGPAILPRLRKGTRSLTRTLLSFFMRLLFRLRVEDLDHLPQESCILVANHESYLDAPCLISKLPKQFMARSVTWIKASRIMERIVKFFARGKNIITVHAKNDLSETLRNSAAVIKAGYNLMVFPEGLRTRDGVLASFRPGFAMVACHTKVPVVPVAIRGSHQAMPYGRFFPRFGKKISLKILPPLFPGENEKPEELAKRAREAIAKVIEDKDA